MFSLVHIVSIWCTSAACIGGSSLPSFLDLLAEPAPVQTEKLQLDTYIAFSHSSLFHLETDLKGGCCFRNAFFSSIILLLILIFFCLLCPANLSMAPASSSGPPSLRKDSTPVIANVVSLASTPAAQPTVNSNNVLQGKAADYDACTFTSLFLNIYICSGIFFLN